MLFYVGCFFGFMRSIRFGLGCLWFSSRQAGIAMRISISFSKQRALRLSSDPKLDGQILSAR